MKRTIRAVATSAILLFAATACAADGGLSDEQKAAVDRGETNSRTLQLTGDFSTSEVLDGRTGAVTSLSEVVTGDRPVLMWYWAPT